MKIVKLNEEIYGPDGKVLKTDDEIESDIRAREQKKSYDQSSQKILDTIESTSYNDEQALVSDVISLIDAWQKGR